jgi:hypothetical protein
VYYQFVPFITATEHLFTIDKMINDKCGRNNRAIKAIMEVQTPADLNKLFTGQQ